MGFNDLLGIAKRPAGGGLGRVTLRNILAYGSVATQIPRFNTIVEDNGGSDIIWSVDGAQGTQLKIGTAGLYHGCMQIVGSSGSRSTAGFSVNASPGDCATAIQNITFSSRLCFQYTGTPSAGDTSIAFASFVAYLYPGDIIRPHTAAAGVSTETYAQMSLFRIY